MMLLIILLLLSAVLNLVLIFILVLKYDEQKLNIGIMKSSNVEKIEYFNLHKPNSLTY